jgi:hypothetical protein
VAETLAGRAGAVGAAGVQIDVVVVGLARHDLTEELLNQERRAKALAMRRM